MKAKHQVVDLKKPTQLDFSRFPALPVGLSDADALAGTIRLDSIG